MVHLLGIGTALKILLLPSEVLATSVSRDEIVALFNTLAALSESISRAQALLQRYLIETGKLDWMQDPKGKPVSPASLKEIGEKMAAEEGTSSGSGAGAGAAAKNRVGAGGDQTGGDHTGSVSALSLDDQVVLKGAELLELLRSRRGESQSSESRESATASEDDVAAVLERVTAESALATVERGRVGDGGQGGADSSSPTEVLTADAVIVGSGLAGMSAALTALERGSFVIIVEKEKRLGGNSGKASSGINGEFWEAETILKSKEAIAGPEAVPELFAAAAPANATNTGQFNEETVLEETIRPIVQHSPKLESFYADTMKSGGGLSIRSRVSLMIASSHEALSWLQTLGVDLSQTALLGGHSAPRTHRPAGGFVGAETIFVLEKKLREYEKMGRLAIFTETAVTGLIVEAGNDVEAGNGAVENKSSSERSVVSERGGGRGPNRVLGVSCKRTNKNRSQRLRIVAPATLLATGGFGHDFQQQNSYLRQHRPDLAPLPTTLGAWTTGDGLRLAESIGGSLIHMDQVQVHPTGFVDPADRTAKTKTLAAEVLRGIGGLLFTNEGKRFVNELDTRQAVVDEMNKVSAGEKKRGFVSRIKNWWKGAPSTSSGSSAPAEFWLVLGKDARKAAEKHVKHYVRKNLLKIVTGEQLEQITDKPFLKNFRAALAEYAEAATSTTKKDRFGKTAFSNVPDPEEDEFVVGLVTPVVHYTMGGVKVDDHHRVMAGAVNNERVVPGLFAAGEAAGGVHGRNRLGGNSLLECAVFGRLVGKQLPAQQDRSTSSSSLENLIKKIRASAGVRSSTLDEDQHGASGGSASKKPLKKFTLEALQQSAKKDQDGSGKCLVALYGQVYDLTSYAAIHPGGAESIQELCGSDGTDAFDAVHTPNMLEVFTPVGEMATGDGVGEMTNNDASGKTDNLHREEL